MTMVIKMPYTEKEKDEFYSSLSGATAKAPCQCDECSEPLNRDDAYAVLKIFLAFVALLIIAWWVLS